LASLFPGLTVASTLETQLTAVQPLTSRPDAIRYSAEKSNKNAAQIDKIMAKDGHIEAIPVVLQPTEIRTFLVKFSASVSGKVLIV
jgi:hypothetical protein